MYGNAQGTIENIWVIKEFEKEEIPPIRFLSVFFLYSISRYGHFFSGESYIILYKYPVRNKDEYVIFFWQGRNSSVNEKGTSAYLTVDLSDSIVGGQAVAQVRVVQNKEPKYFLDIFGGKIIVHHSKRIQDHGTATLYEVCENETGVHIVQVEPSSQSLKSNRSFIIITPEKVILW
jgi:advillin